MSHPRYCGPLTTTIPHIHTYREETIFANPSVRVGYDTKSIFNQSLTGFNSVFSFYYTCCLTKAKNQYSLLFANSCRENNWIHTFP